MGCKFFKFKGLWEEVINEDEPEEGTEGICLTVAVASIMNYYRWPIASKFDGVYMTSKNTRIIKPISHRWNYRLITGGKGAMVDCESDDPSERRLDSNPSWTGLDEIRQLMYVVERSYGHDHEYFHLPGDVCGEYGYYALEHVLRNRFGYAGARSIDLRRPDAKTLIARNLKKKTPVIALKCEHAFVLDGYRVDPCTKGPSFHSTDYVQEETTMGWFPWQQFVDEGVVAAIVGLNPVIELGKGPYQKAVNFSWGDHFVPATSHTVRSGRITIHSGSSEDLGALSLEVRAKDLESGSDQKLYSYRGTVRSTRMTIPPQAPFEFVVDESTEVTLTIRNNDKRRKQLMLEFSDFEVSPTM